MTRSEQVFLLILILNTMVAIGYLICCMVRNGWKAPRRKEYWIKTIVMIICPLVGPAFFLTVWFVYYLLFIRMWTWRTLCFPRNAWRRT